MAGLDCGHLERDTRVACAVTMGMEVLGNVVAMGWGLG